VEVTDFADVAEEFRRRIEQTQWATMTTVDERGRPRGRLVHPVWEEPVCWLATGRHSFKARHLERNPYVSLAYWETSRTSRSMPSASRPGSTTTRSAGDYGTSTR
jgi:pyridoxine/pyridoxamine 5'-phosphate oxidase